MFSTLRCRASSLPRLASRAKAFPRNRRLLLSSLALGSLLTSASLCHASLEDLSQRLAFLEGCVTQFSELFASVQETRRANPNNLAAKHFDAAYFLALSADKQKRLLKIVKSGLENADSGMGCYAMNADDYDTFKPFFEKVINEYHKIEGGKKHVTNWKMHVLDDQVLDLTKLGLGETSMRVRVGRNLEKYPLPGAMDRDDRVQLEKDMVGAFKNLIADPKFGGNYFSLTPGSEHEISKDKYNELVKKHIMFKDMASDSYLNSAGISSDWPYGRGCYVSADKGFIVWVGEEDHLRIMCMKKGTVLNDVFDRLQNACDVVEKRASKFAHSDTYGYVTSCPTNLGTGMRASVHIKVPNLTKDGTETKAKAVCKPLGLSVRGVGGEHTPIGADGTVDISPSARLCIEEQQIIQNLYQGIKLLLIEENKAKL